MAKRDEFTDKTKRTIAFRSACVCAFSLCGKTTFGPHVDEEKHVNLGQACHITAAAPGGPRYDSTLTSEERRSVTNGIWMCLEHARLIDADPDDFSVDLLRRWKAEAEQRAKENRSGAEGSPGWYCQAPGPDDDFIPRAQLDEMVEALLQGADKGDVFALTGLQGAGGFGKTTLAKKIAWDERVRAAFPDGVFWTVVGEKPNEAALIQSICEPLKSWTREAIPTFDTATGAGQFLKKVLLGRRVLVVVDDVWRAKDLRPFKDLGPGSALLVTTRMREVLPRGICRIDVDQMQADEAVSLLSYGFTSEGASLSFGSLADLLGRWPLLLKLANAQLHRLCDGGLGPSEALERAEKDLKRRGLTAFDRTNEDERERAVALTMEASFESGLLSREDRARYLSLAVFPEDTDIPFSVLAPLWNQEMDECEDTCRRFFEASLVVKLDIRRGVIRLHDVFRNYLLDLTGENKVEQIHRRLLSACRPADGAWWSLPSEDLYLWMHLAHHLKEADHLKVLDELLVNPKYMMAKLKVTGVQPLLSDYQGRDRDRQLIADAIRKSAHCLGSDPRQLPGQLIGRLAEGRSPVLQSLVENLRPYPGLSPSRGSLIPAGHALRQTLFGHTGRVNAVGVIEGGRIVSASSDQTLRVWDVETGACLHTLEGHIGVVSAVGVIEGGRIVSASFDQTLRVWDVETGSCLHTLEGHTGRVSAVGVIDGGRIVSGSEDETLRVWDVETGACLHTLEGHIGGASAVGVIEGGRIVSASDDRTLRVWDVETGACFPTLERYAGTVRAVGEIDGGRVVTASFFDPMLRVWDVETGACLHTLEGHTGRVSAVGVIDGGRVVTASSDQTLRVWDVETGACLHTLEGHTGVVSAVGVIEGGRIVSASSDQTLRVWDVETGACLHTLERHTGGVSAVGVIEGGRIVSGSSDETLRVWDVETGACLPALERHTGGVSAVGVIEGGRIVSASTFEKTLRVWDVETGACLHTLEGNKGRVSAVGVIDGGRIVSASFDLTLRVWDVETGACLHTLGGHTGLVSAVGVIEGGRIVSASFDQTLRVWDVETGACLHTLEGHTGRVSAVGVIDGGRIVSASFDQTLRVWDVETGACLHTLEGHTGGVSAVGVIEGGRIVSAFTFEKTLRVWDVETGACLHTLEGHTGGVSAVGVIEGGRIVSGSEDETLRVWDVETGACLHTLEGHKGRVSAVGVIEGGRIVSGSEDETLRVWDVETGEWQAFTAAGRVTAWAKVMERDQIVVGDASGRVHFLTLVS